MCTEVYSCEQKCTVFCSLYRSQLQTSILYFNFLKAVYDKNRKKTLFDNQLSEKMHTCILQTLFHYSSNKEHKWIVNEILFNSEPSYWLVWSWQKEHFYNRPLPSLPYYIRHTCSICRFFYFFCNSFINTYMSISKAKTSYSLS